jgi:hypothetical protein
MNGSKKTVREASLKTFYARAACIKYREEREGSNFFTSEHNATYSPFFFSRYTHALTDHKKLSAVWGSPSLAVLRARSVSSPARRRIPRDCPAEKVGELVYRTGIRCQEASTEKLFMLHVQLTL